MSTEEYDNEDLFDLPEEVAETLSERLPRGYLSVSQIGQYTKCGAAYEYRYIYEIGVPRNSFMVQGSAVHKGIEMLNLSLLGSPIPPPKEFILDVYSDTLDEIFTDDVVIAEEDVSKDKVKDVGIALASLYYKGATGLEGGVKDLDTGADFEVVQPVAVEKVIRKEIQPADGSAPVPFLGIIDLVEPTRVVDFKTSKKKGAQSLADNSLQLSLYSHLENKPDVRIDQLVKPLKKTPERYVRLSSTRTAQEVAHATIIAAETAAGIVAGRFPRTMPDNWWCSKDWCAYWGLCRGKKS